MSAPRAQIAQTDAGFLARVRGANSRKVFQSESYPRSRAAYNALRVLGDLFSPVGKAVIVGDWLIVHLEADDLGEKFAVPIERVDEREATR